MHNATSDLVNFTNIIKSFTTICYWTEKPIVECNPKRYFCSVIVKQCLKSDDRIQ